MAACESRLMALIDAASGDLSGAERAALDAHLPGCEGCRTELAELRQTERALQATVRTPDDLQLSGFAYRVADRAEAFRDHSARGLWWSLTRAMRLTMATSGLAMAASAVLLVLSVHPTRSNAPVVTNGHAGVSSPAERPLFDVEQLVAEDHGVPDVSFDSALDGLTTEDLDTLSQQLATGSG